MLLTNFNWPLNDFNCATDVGHKLHGKWLVILDFALQIIFENGDFNQGVQVEEILYGDLWSKLNYLIRF